ncbi:hypothetical protein LOTGIDRAFT_177067, partial [Lottia gigantea]
VIIMRPDYPPTRYLLNMFKTDNVAKLRKQIKDLTSLPDGDIIIAEVLDCHISRLLVGIVGRGEERVAGGIIIAEVLDCHISRLLDDNILLRYVNDSTRKIYAFEMMTPEKLPELPPTTVAMETTVVSANQDSDYSIPPIASEPGDIFSAMGTFSPNTFDQSRHRSFSSKSESSTD